MTFRLFSKKNRNSKPQQEQLVIEGSTDTEALIETALKNYKDSLRAVRQLVNLGDEDSLMKIAMYKVPYDGADLCSLAEPIRTAIDAVRDQAVLKNIAMNAATNYARVEAVRRLEDRTALAKIAEIRSSVPKPEYAALWDMPGMKASAVPVGEAAMDRLAELDGSEAARWMAMIIRETDDALVRDRAFTILTGFEGRETAEALSDVAGGCRDSKMRTAAVRKLIEWEEDDLLAQVACNGSIPEGDNDWNITVTTLEAARGIKNQAALEKVAREAPKDMVRSCAVERMEDKDLAAEIALKDQAAMVYAAGIALLTDPEQLVKIVGENPGLRGAIVSNPHFADQAVLADAALNDEDWRIRQEAILNANLTDLQLLETVALKDKSEEIRECAVHRIDDADALERIAAQCSGPEDAASWYAAVKLAWIAPDKAVGPLVKQMLLNRDTSFKNMVLIPAETGSLTKVNLREETVRFLKNYYQETSNPAVRKTIASPPEVSYGSNDNDPWHRGPSQVVIWFRPDA